LTILDRFINNVKVSLGLAIQEAEQSVIGGIAQIPAVQQQIQSQIDFKVRAFMWKAIPIALVALAVILLFRERK
jgi:hypothetical protein